MASQSRILVVEDELLLLETACEILGRMGFETVAARDGVEALQKLEQSSFSLILTDIRMPRMGGIELALKARLARPGICVLFTTGYTEHIELLEEAGEAVLEKPYWSSDLERFVREHLPSPHAGLA